MVYKKGELIADRYRYLHMLGKGGMGEVFLVEDIRITDKQWAIKRLPLQNNTEIDLLVERNIMKNLNHPALPRIIDFIDKDDALFIVMDYVDGVSLDRILQEENHIPAALAIEWAKQICEVFIYLHESQSNPIIYRDMKPSNIMVLPDKTVNIIDFGIAREYKEEAATDTQYLGTKGYAAPEQSTVGKQTDERSDIYSLGVTLYHLLTGIAPQRLVAFKPIRELNEEIPEGLEVILEKMLQPDPDHRYQSARELLTALHQIEKQTVAYKQYKRRRTFKSISYLFSLLLFSVIMMAGYTEIKAEKVEAYTELVEKGNAKLKQLEFGQAHDLFNQAIELSESDLAAYQGIAHSLYETGQYEEVLIYIDELFSNIPAAREEADLFFLLGNAYYELKDYAHAIDNFKQATDFSPEVMMYQLNLAISFAKNGDLNRAQELLAEIGKDYPASDLAWYVNGEILAVDGAVEEGLINFKKVLDEGTDPYLYMKSALAASELYEAHAILLEDEHVEKRIAVLQQGLKQVDGEHNLLLTESLAKAYYDKAIYENDDHAYYKKSIKQFKALLSNGYQRPYIYRNISIIYLNMKELAEAEKVLKDMKELYPEDYTCYLQFAFLYAEIENEKQQEVRDYQKVVDNYELALTYSPEGKDSPELQPLNNLIEELRIKKWID